MIMKKTPLAVVTLGALGVVYGDIGTSPLYALNEVFFGSGELPLTPEHIVGVASLIFWIFIITIGIKYAGFVLQADHEGEGGVFALFSVLKRFDRKQYIPPIALLLMFGAGLLFGDGIITPAISVLSAVEGLKNISPLFTPWVVPLTVAILLGIFFLQKKGSAQMGKIYGPVMLLWFGVISALGAWQIYLYPQIISQILNPLSAVNMLRSLDVTGTALLLGAVFLVLTGSEALYADLGHFGKRAIRIGWFVIVFPALVLNYAGQSAFLLRGGVVSSNNLFYSLVPELFLMPMILLATLATIIASVAMIFGAYSLVSQAIALQLLPRFRVIHTNREEKGQIYIPVMNWALCIGSISLVIGFGSATSLAAAYGFAVSSVMIITSLAMVFLSRYEWGWKRTSSVAIFGAMAIIDLLFFLANTVKFWQGGFIPFFIGVFIFSIVITWRWGRKVLSTAHIAYTHNRQMQWFLDLKQRLTMAGGRLNEENRTRQLVEIDRAVVFFVGRPIMKSTDIIPSKLRIYLKRKGAIPKNILFLHIEQQGGTPYLSHHYKVADLGEGVFCAHASFGFMEDPDAAEVLRHLYNHYDIFEKKFRRCTIEVSSDELIIDNNVKWHVQLRAQFFKRLLEWSVPPYRYFGLYGEASAGLSKTVIPIRLSRKGIRIEVPEFPMIKKYEKISPDTNKLISTPFTKI